jgi:ABC-type dipeptide/oligopeptide/nickel transport system ATPase component
MASGTRGLSRGIGRLRLAPIRSRDSLALEQTAAGLGYELPPYVPWETFLRDHFRWRQGEHVTFVGKSGSGKTTLARQILPQRDYDVVLATKKNDPSLYGPLEAQGFVIVDEFDPDPRQTPKVIYRPRLTSPTAEGRAEQQDAFRETLVSIFETGGWCVFLDEILYQTENLRLGTEVETLYLQGRSLGVTMVAGTQRPARIPVIAWDAPHLFMFKATNKQDVIRMSEFSGINIDVAREMIPRLPRHEALYINTVTDEILRTKVSL